MKKILALVSVLMIAALLGGCITTGSNNQQTVSSSGTAVLKVTPDEADVVIAVETLEKSADDSKNKNAAIVDKVYAALYKINIPRDSIKTENFNIYEEYDWTLAGQQKSKGFRTSHTLRVTVKDFALVGKIVDAAVDAGATRIQGVEFDLSDATKASLKKQALAEASKDAREKAEAIASGLNAELGKIVSVSDSSYDYTPYPYLRTAMEGDMAKAEFAGTEISPQELEVRANVQVVFELE